MSHRKFLLAALALAALAGTASAHRGRNARREPGPFRHMVCYGATFNDGFTDDELRAGAYGAWCFDDTGKKIGKIHHGPVFAPDGSFLPRIEVSFSHYEDRNRDGIFQDREEDGYILTRYVTEGGMDRVVLAFDADDPTKAQAVVALEIPRALEQLPIATGWFAGTEQLVNRTNVRIDFTANPGIVVYNNFSSLSFMRNAVTIER